eukprot:TRINITY_DN10680_c1_g1_i2.p1 TRINITY_DN10680_c1_g1~~TRINITY_DN10680_c1_g1_i2.p1  ORF type:complete len:536 (+),score=64.85 TRINITY_DN10680_c1_g1_i2:147-1754(+)
MNSVCRPLAQKVECCGCATTQLQRHSNRQDKQRRPFVFPGNFHDVPASLSTTFRLDYNIHPLKEPVLDPVCVTSTSRRELSSAFSSLNFFEISEPLIAKPFSKLLAPRFYLHRRNSGTRRSRVQSADFPSKQEDGVRLEGLRNLHKLCNSCTSARSSVTAGSARMANPVADTKSPIFAGEGSTDVSANEAAKKVVVGCGGAAVDYLAEVASYPSPDDKIRTTDLLVCGGGNVGNALTAAARLGLQPRIISKVADDALGKSILGELEDDGIDTSHIVVAEGGVSPFTYIIVDRETKTRTCIHTAGRPPLLESEVSKASIASVLEGADLVYFDGRLPQVAINVAKEACRRGLPVLLDAERPREGLDELLEMSDYVVTASNFPTLWTGATTLGEAMLLVACRLPKLKFVITTLGSRGCAMLDLRHGANSLDGNDSSIHAPDDVLEELWRQAESGGEAVESKAPRVRSSQICNFNSKATEHELAVRGRLRVATSFVLSKAEVVDTTGAGDAFIGAVLYGLCVDLEAEKTLALASTVGWK